MFALVKNDGSINVFSPNSIWEDKNGTQYSPDQLLILTTGQKQDLGIYDVAYANYPDDRFYSITQNDPEFDATAKIVNITFTAVARDLEDASEPDITGNTPAGLKTQWINKFKANANSLLAQTDWTLVRKIERNIDVPSSVATFRAAVVAESNRLEAAISACTTITEFITAVETASWPTAE